MSTGFYDYDKKLKAHAPFKRYASFAAAGIDISDARFNPDPNVMFLVKTYQDQMQRLLMAKFKKPQLVRSDYGQLVNVDEAFEGIPECYRHTRLVKPVLKIGINLSANYNASDEVYAYRAAATIALYNFAKSRGQNVQFDVCYGTGCSNKLDGTAYSTVNATKQNMSKFQSHVRITCANPMPEMITRIQTSAMRLKVSDLVYKLSGEDGNLYRLHEHKELLGWNEFDFAIDRIETMDLETEKARILKQIEHLR